ncbi:MAG: cell division protein FtsA [Gammaproteobacteria bacterium]|nr:cell division protein FtsA [Gammaproteobacteria bacterium]
MSGGNDFIASIDIGTDKIAVLVAEKEDDVMRLIGHGVGPSSGVRKGNVSAIESLSRAISKTLEKANKSFNGEIALVRANLSDTHLTCFDRSGRIPINQIVEKEDVEKVLESARAITTPTNKEVLHVINKKFTLNETQVIENPVEMEASVLESEVHIVTVSSSSMRNIENSLKQSDLSVDSIVLDSIASSQALLTQEEKDAGVCLLDFGAGVTNFSVFQQGGIVYSGVIPVGGNDITQEVAIAFDTSFEEAQRLKEEHGCAKASTIRGEHLVEFVQVTNKDPHQLSNLTLSEVIEEAYMEILALVKSDLKHRNLEAGIKAGFVLCGGGAEVGGAEDLVRGFFSRRVKKGVVQRSVVSGLESIIGDYRFSGAIGLLLHKEDVPQQTLVKAKGGVGFVGKMRNILVGEF